MKNHRNKDSRGIFCRNVRLERVSEWCRKTSPRETAATPARGAREEPFQRFVLLPAGQPSGARTLIPKGHGSRFAVRPTFNSVRPSKSGSARPRRRRPLARECDRRRSLPFRVMVRELPQRPAWQIVSHQPLEAPQPLKVEQDLHPVRAWTIPMARHQNRTRGTTAPRMRGRGCASRSRSNSNCSASSADSRPGRWTSRGPSSRNSSGDGSSDVSRRAGTRCGSIA